MKKKLFSKLMGAMFSFALIFSNKFVYAADESMLRAPSKNYNDGYYYSHGVSGRLADNRNWMGFIDDNKNISELSVPGTHDTMANYELTNMVRTQSMSLMGQLESGIRFLDIRCNYTDGSDGGKFKINHGFIGLKYDFDDVLTTVKSFLDENPTESVFMRVKQEHSSKSDEEFDKKLREYVSRYSKYFWDDAFNSNPKLGDVRGKIVVFNDVFSSRVGLSYRSAEKQDNYTLDSNWSLHNKWLDVKNFLNKTRNGNINKVYINYLSASGGSFPYFVASGQSSPEMSAPRLSTGLAGPAFSHYYPDFPRGNMNDILFEGTNILATANILSNEGRVGIIVSDFPGSGLINSVISRNDFGTNNYISVGGVSYNGDRALEGIKVNFDLLRNEIYLSNRVNGPIHSGFENNKYFTFRLLDKDYNEKASITLNGNDSPNDSKYDKLNFIKFEVGDIVEVEHEEAFRLNISGQTQKNKRELYKITSYGLSKNHFNLNNYISVGGVSYNGDKELEAIRVNFDLLNDRIYLSNRLNESIHAGFGDNEYFTLRLLDKNYNEKISISLKGNDNPSDPKYDKLNFAKFEVGDIVEVEHEEAFRLNISGQNQHNKKYVYKITINGLKAINSINNSSIKISGSGGGSFELLFKDNLIKLSNRIGGVFASEYTGFNNYYIEVVLSTKDGRVKAKSGIYGSMFAQSAELNNLDNVKFEYGDILTINHMSPQYIKVKGPIIGKNINSGNQKYEITRLGFKAIR